MAVNLATKYSSQIAEVFTAGSFVKGKTSTTFDLTGVKTLKVYTPVTVPEVDYTREGMARYGTVTEMQDIVQELKMTQDKAFTLTIDKGNYLDQNMSKKAADMLRLQINEQSTPAADKYALKRFAMMAGTIATTETAPTKETIVEMISTGAQTLDDNLVPDGDRYLYVTAEGYKMIRLSPEFTGLEGLGVKAIGKGVCGEIAGLNIVRVPKSYMPALLRCICARRKEQWRVCAGAEEQQADRADSRVQFADRDGDQAKRRRGNAIYGRRH